MIAEVACQTVVSLLLCDIQHRLSRKEILMENGYDRLRFDSVYLTEESPEECTVEVNFSFVGRTIQKSFKGPADDASKLKTAAVATLEAVKEAVEHHFDCSLADLD